MDIVSGSVARMIERAYVCNRLQSEIILELTPPNLHVKYHYETWNNGLRDSQSVTKFTTIPNVIQ